MTILSFCNVAYASVSVDVYQERMEQHRQRVIIFAFAAYQQFPEYFKSIYPELINYYFHYHDLPKLLGMEDLNKWGYRHSETLAERLSAFYGIGREKVDPANRRVLLEAIDDLNEVEARIKNQAHYGLSERQISELRKLEEWADVTDTKIFRREEVGIEGGAFEAAKFLRAKNDETGAIVSIYLEVNYHKILVLEPTVCYGVFDN